MKRREEGKANVALYVGIVIAVAVVIAIVAFFLLNGSDIRKETITAENYEEMLDKLDKKLAGQDDLYYISYSVMYHLMTDGMNATDENKEEAMYSNIYGKTVQELIDDGKKLMEEENVSIDQVKQTLDQLSNSVSN